MGTESIPNGKELMSTASCICDPGGLCLSPVGGFLVLSGHMMDSGLGSDGRQMVGNFSTTRACLLTQEQSMHTFNYNSFIGLVNFFR